MELTKEEIAALGLLPCPFCGHDAHIRPWHGGAPTKQLVACGALYDDEADICRVSPGVTGETPKEAAERWNARATPAESISESLGSMSWLSKRGYINGLSYAQGVCQQAGSRVALRVIMREIERAEKQ